MSEKYFKFTTRVQGMKEPFVDWYYGDTEQDARRVWDEDCHRYGMPLKELQLTVEEISKEQWDITT